MSGGKLFIALLFVAGGSITAAAAEEPPNIVFILIDALRADHLACLGYDRATSPVMDSLAASGWLFTNNKAQSSYTRTSMSSLFTSRYTSDRSLLPTAAEGDDRTLAEILQAHGYFNVAIQANPQMQEKWGYARGFDRYWMIRPEGYTISLEQNWWLAEADRNCFYSDAARLADVFDDIVGNNAQKRFFIYVHFLDVHEPYMPPEEHQVFSDRKLSVGEAAALSGKFITRKDRGLRAAAVDLYDGEIHFTDAAVGRMMESLRSRGLCGKTVVVIAADHGEEFLDHGGTRHSNGLYEEVIHTPLIITGPGIEPARWEGLTRNVDIAPTILKLALIRDDWGERDGASLFDVVSKAKKVTTSVARLYLDTNHTVRCWNSVERNGLKFIDAHLPNFEYTELFDLNLDPGETTDISESRTKEAASLAAVLESARGAEEVRGKAVVDDETARALKSLGYLQ